MQEPPSKSKKQVPIAVYVRQRPLSKQEIDERTPCILDILPNCQGISVRHPTCLKEYEYNEVFGPDCTQAHVYYRVLEPLIAEVLEGYNCTVFAYGQTGTGKTHTIIGDLKKCSEENPNAGLISRAAAHIFQDLNRSSVKEYTVRVSFVELYNEELKDLLRDADSDGTNLKIYDDPRQKGSVFIQNLSEKTVCNAEEVYELLLKGMEKRQTHATLLNDLSSRSHCVFMINVYVKEILVEGIVTVKTGKLNLVDLAGSENISRSGAVNTRAREAGNINQSLLTLGRVIKALVQRQQHIPYRESKLTRILQDSLGGRTKTAIIATVSPSLACFEETISTLDYAHRACHIVNCPEANRNSSKSQVVDMLTKQIAAAQKDIAALRFGSGFYVDADNYQDLLTEKEKTEKLVLSKNEFIFQLEERIKEFTNIKENEQKRWDELMESFNFTKMKYEEYKRKSLKAKIKTKLMQDLINLQSDYAKRTASKNKEMKTSIINLTIAIDGLNKKLNSCYYSSAQRAADHKTLSKALTDTIDGTDNITQTQGKEIKMNEVNVKTSLQKIIHLIDSAVARSKKSDVNALIVDLTEKEAEVENIFKDEKLLNCVNYCKRTHNTINNVENLSHDFWENTFDEVDNNVSEFQKKIESEKRKIHQVYTNVCGRTEEVKTGHLQKASNSNVRLFKEDVMSSFSQLENFVSSRVSLLTSKQKMIEEIKRDLEQIEAETTKEYEIYTNMLKKTKGTAKMIDSHVVTALEVSKKNCEKLETLNPSKQLQEISSYVNESDAEKQSIIEKYVKDFKHTQSNFESQLLPLCWKVKNEISEAFKQYKTSIQEESSLAKAFIVKLKRLASDSDQNRTEKLTTMNSYAHEKNDLAGRLNYENLAKKAYEELSSLDKENVCVNEYRQKWFEVEPAGDTPKKQTSNYRRSLIHFNTPTPTKNIKCGVDDSLLDVSVGSVNISMAQPEEVQNLDELLEGVDISINESVCVPESEAELSSPHTSR